MRIYLLEGKNYALILSLVCLCCALTACKGSEKELDTAEAQVTEEAQAQVTEEKETAPAGDADLNATEDAAETEEPPVVVELPEMPEGVEPPERPDMPERPKMPEGTQPPAFPGGNMPARPGEGADMPDFEQMPETGQMPDIEQMPGGGLPEAALTPNGTVRVLVTLKSGVSVQDGLAAISKEVLNGATPEVNRTDEGTGEVSITVTPEQFEALGDCSVVETVKAQLQVPMQ